MRMCQLGFRAERTGGQRTHAGRRRGCLSGWPKGGSDSVGTRRPNRLAGNLRNGPRLVPPFSRNFTTVHLGTVGAKGVVVPVVEKIPPCNVLLGNSKSPAAVDLSSYVHQLPRASGFGEPICDRCASSWRDVECHSSADQREAGESVNIDRATRVGGGDVTARSSARLRLAKDDITKTADCVDSV